MERPGAVFHQKVKETVVRHGDRQRPVDLLQNVCGNGRKRQMILLHKILLSECENVTAGKCQEDMNSRDDG